MLKTGNYIKVKKNTKIESGEIVDNWVGEIQEIYKKEKCCLVSLDAQTIDSLSDSFLLGTIEKEAEPFQYIFSLDEVELSERRDSDQEVMVALEKLSSRMIELEEKIENEQYEIKEKWIQEFESSNYCDSLNDYQKENANFVADTFMGFMYNYEYVKPHDWTPSNVEFVCLNIVPRKITSEIETFENYGDILIQFLMFLGSKSYISNSKKLITRVDKIKGKIAIEAKNPKNWGMAKSLMMSAQNQGFDITDEEDIESFMMLKQLEAINQIEEEEKSRIIPLKVNPYKDIGRNQKITVKYTDGKICENTKFKKVEKDLKNGLCEIIKK
jgi:hypothetical protein